MILYFVIISVIWC